MFFLLFDRKSLSLRLAAVAAVPYLVTFGSWGLYVAQYPDEMGKAAVEMAVKAMKGEAVQADVGVRIGLVTRENAAK